MKTFCICVMCSISLTLLTGLLVFLSWWFERAPEWLKTSDVNGSEIYGVAVIIPSILFLLGLVFATFSICFNIQDRKQ